jgi:hypothetical protein
MIPPVAVHAMIQRTDASRAGALRGGRCGRRKAAWHDYGRKTCHRSQSAVALDLRLADGNHEPFLMGENNGVESTISMTDLTPGLFFFDPPAINTPFPSPLHPSRRRPARMPDAGI